MRFCIYLLTLLMLVPAVKSQQRADSLLVLFDAHITDGNLTEADMDLYRLRLEVQSYKPVKAIEYLRQAQQIAERHDQPYLLGHCYTILGNLYFDQELYFQALDYQVKCYQLYRDNGLDDSLGYVYIDIGNVYFAQALYELPEQYYRKSALTFEKLNNQWGLSVAYNNIALVNQRKERWDTASYYFHEALRLREEMNNPYLIAHSYNYLGNLHRLQKQYTRAEEFLLRGEIKAREALKLPRNPFEQANIMDILAGIQNSVGLVNSEQGHYDDAIQYYRFALNSFGNNIKNTGNIINTHLAIGEIYRTTKDWANAEMYARKALDLSESSRRTETKLKALLLLSGIMNDRNKKPEALTFLQTYAELERQNSESNRLSKITDFQSVLNDYENQIQLKQTEQSLKRKDKESLVLLTALLSMFVFGFVIYLFYRSKVKTGRELEEKNRRITEQSRILEKEIEDRKAAEFQVRKLFTAIEQSANTVVITDVQGTIEYVNPRFTEITGYTSEEAVGQNPRILKSKLKKPEEYTELWKTILSGNVWRGLFLNRKKDGTEYWEEATISPIKNDGGEIEHFIAVKEDITERKKLQDNLAASEKNYRTVFNQMRDGLYRTTPDGKFIDANPAYVRMYGYESIDEMRNLDVIRDMYFSADDRDEVNRLSKQGKLTTFRQKKKDGSEIWVEDSGYFIRDDKGEIIFHEGIIRDVTQRVKAEEALQESENRHRQLIENINDVLFSLNAEGLITFISKAMLAVSGYRNTDLLGHPFKLFVHPHDLQKADDHFRKVLSGATDETELRVFKKNKEPFWISVSSSPNLQGGKVTGIQGLLSDISARKLAEEIKNRNEIRLKSLLDLSQKSFQMDEKEIIQNALDNAVKLTGSKIGYCHFINEDQQSIELVTWSEDTLKVCDAVHEKHYPLSQAGVWADCVRQRQPVIHNDYPNLKEKIGLPSGHAELIRHMSVPVIEDGHAKVIMGVGNKDVYYYDADVRQLQLIANDTWRMVQRKRLEQEREKIIRDLQEAMSRIKTLSGLLPICASCKKIRDDKGYWHQIENYISSHSDADFSHSICKECQQKLYPELFKDDSQ